MSSSPLSVLHFSTADVIGGSAQSAYRLHTGLRARNVGSRMLVGVRAGNDPDVDTVYAGPLGQRADRLANKISGSLGYQYAYMPSGHRVARHRWVREADIIQLFNIHGGYLSPRSLPVLSRQAPIVWRLSDLWPMTGHCAYPGPCGGWRTGCGNCPDLYSYPAVSRDKTAEVFRWKQRLYGDLGVTVVATSSWTEECARNSPILGGCRVLRIPNGLNGDIYRPADRQNARNDLGLDPQRRIVLFSAHILDDNPRKGGDQLIEALHRIAAGPETLLLLVGQGGDSWRGRVPCDLKILEFQNNHDRMARIYAAADVVAVPSVVENLPNVLIEALACGRPVVACDAGGMADGVRHMETGYLARREDPQDIAEGLKILLGDANLRSGMERRARALFESEFNADLEIQRFQDLYADLCEMRNRAVSSLSGGRNS